MKVNNHSCISWRQTDSCDQSPSRSLRVGRAVFLGQMGHSNVPQETSHDKQCDEIIPNRVAGYCECVNGKKKMVKGCGEAGGYSTCNDASLCDILE